MSKYQEALDNLQKLVDETLDNLQKLVDKETPKKPLEDNYLGEFMCECGSPITKDCKYCPNCGQKLNWSYKEVI